MVAKPCARRAIKASRGVRRANHSTTGGSLSKGGGRSNRKRGPESGDNDGHLVEHKMVGWWDALALDRQTL
jgi:hypothetical protein